MLERMSLAEACHTQHHKAAVVVPFVDSGAAARTAEDGSLEAMWTALVARRVGKSVLLLVFVASSSSKPYECCPWS